MSGKEGSSFKPEQRGTISPKVYLSSKKKGKLGGFGKKGGNPLAEKNRGRASRHFKTISRPTLITSARLRETVEKG